MNSKYSTGILPNTLNRPDKKHAISTHKSMTFKVTKKDGQLIMSESEGPLFDAFGLKPEDVLGKKISDIFPKEIADFKTQCFEKALEGDSVTYESEINGIPFLAALHPIKKDGRILEVRGFCLDITDRAEMLQQLEESEQRFRSLIDHNMDPLFSLDVNGKFTTVNKACEKLTGYSTADLLQMNYLSFLLPEQESYIKSRFAHALNGEAHTTELSIKTRSSDIRQILLTCTPIIVKNSILGIYGIAKDITEKNQAERDLRETKELLESVIYHSTDAISIINFTDQTMQVNPAFEDIFGWSLEEVLHLEKGIIPTIPDELMEEYHRLIEIIKKGGFVKSMETIRTTKKGERINVSLSLSPIFDDDGEVVALSAISRDITDSKLKEKALKKSEEKYRIIAENTMDIIAVTESGGYVKYVSPSNLEVLGIKPSSYIGKQALRYIHPDDQKKVQESINKMKDEKLPVKFEMRCINADGDWVLMEANATPVFSDNNQLESIVIVSRDLTERKKTEEMLRKSDKLSVLGQLAAGVAHEIRNPLTSIKGFLQLLQSKTEENAEFYKIMLSEIDRINSIVSEFMLLAKPQVMNYSKTDIRDLLYHVISLLEAQASLMNVQIYYDVEEPLPEIWCVENQIKQVFVNMLKNAIEAMPQGGTTRIRLWSEDGFVIASFIDEGCGIPNDRIKTLGEPFYTTKEKGTGLGLMICYKIIDHHGGKIKIESKIGEGSIFSIYLPLTEKMPESE